MNGERIWKEEVIVPGHLTEIRIECVQSRVIQTTVMKLRP
jgi:hypothetical protein